MKIGLVSGLFLLLLALKLCGVIHWSWWLVLMPLWLPVAALVSFVAVVWCCYLYGNRVQQRGTQRARMRLIKDDGEL